MAHMQISTETSTWLLQAKEFLDEARWLRAGPARNEVRQVAKVLRELAKLEAHLAVLFRDAANLNLQLCELKRLRDQASGQTDSIKTHQAPGGRCRIGSHSLARFTS